MFDICLATSANCNVISGSSSSSRLIRFLPGDLSPGGLVRDIAKLEGIMAS